MRRDEDEGAQFGVSYRINYYDAIIRKYGQINCSIKFLKRSSKSSIESIRLEILSRLVRIFESAETDVKNLRLLLKKSNM